MKRTESGKIIIGFGDLSLSLKILVVLTWIVVSFYLIFFIAGLIVGAAGGV